MALKCPRCSHRLRSVLTRASVIVDSCDSCHGTWLDRGEIRFFVSDRRLLEAYASHGITGPREVQMPCPHCQGTWLRAGKFPGLASEVEECPNCRGLFLDEHEMRKLGDSQALSRLREDTRVGASLGWKDAAAPKRALVPPVRLPSLGLTSALVLGSLYAILAGVLVFLVRTGVLPEGFSAVLFLIGMGIQFWLGPILMDWSLRIFGSLTWVGEFQLPPHLRQFIEKTCRDAGIPTPRIGIIEDGAPQAYTYGRTPWSARLVLSRGILQMLDEEEAEAVVAHELGHVLHWDFVVMTIAQLVPLILYQLYRILHESFKNSSRQRGREKAKGAGAVLIAAVVAWFAWRFAEFLVMFVSRVREYWADRFSVELTRKPAALVRALTKVAYGVVAREGDASKEGVSGNRGSMEQRRMAVQALSIMSISDAKGMALLASQPTSTGSPQSQQEDMKDVMRWDLWNPWASLYELQSTHPLTAKRLNAISDCASAMGLEPPVVFDRVKPESYWDDFAVELLVWLLPWIGLAGGVLSMTGFSLTDFPTLLFEGGELPLRALAGMGIGGIVKTWLAHPPGPFVDHSVLSLLKRVKVSPVTSYAVNVRGTVIGRGNPGNVFSEDLVIRDSSGVIFLDYEHGLANWYFALFRFDDFIGQEVEIEGWYRRAPVPYIEVARIRHGQRTDRSYSYFYQMLGWILPFALVLVVALLRRHS